MCALEIIGITVDGREIKLESRNISINSQYGVPADDAAVVLPYSGAVPGLAGLQISDGGKTVFSGNVDVQENTLSSSGKYIRIEARSMAGVLLDNESRPSVYNGASAEIIFQNHVQPYGISGFYGRNVMLPGVFNVTKGMSEWQTVRDFCKSCYGSFPYFAPDGIVYMEPREEDEIVFSGSDGAGYTCLSEKTRRCRLISRVYFKKRGEQGYNRYVEGKRAKLAGVTATRFLDTAESDVTQSCADEIIRLGDEESYSVELSCPYGVFARPGTPARVEDETLGVIENLFVSKIRYTRSQYGEATSVLLKRRE